MTIRKLLETSAMTTVGGIALEGIGRIPLSYRGLEEQVGRTADFLAQYGVRRSTRVAIVLPNGPDLAAAFLGIAACAAAAPLNPAYRTAEFDFFLRDLNAGALMVAAGSDSPARGVAEALSIPIFELEPEQKAGAFRLLCEAVPSGGCVSWAESGDTALLLHTSGTTSRPKLVELTQANLMASADSIAATLRLTPGDRCLNVMPLFHIHGLAAGLLASLQAQGIVVCTPGFDAMRFFEWLETCEPTWYTAVPTMHQAVLGRGEAPVRSSLRFIRSSSAALPPTVMTDLEAMFGVPVIEAYGMTEASHQMASNPLPPGIRKAGSVGLAAGPEITLIDGEVAIRGANVTAGYAGNAAANEEAFRDGWFLTGDLGRMDEDGYLYLTGRSKEIINRGGEKFSPREIDEVLLQHPAVEQAVAFPVAHRSLGQDVAAAVVPRKAATVDPQQLRDFAAARLASFKVPRRIVVVAELPKGPSGKVQRLKLAETLAVESQAFVAPSSEMEHVVADVWRKLLQMDEPGIDDDFAELGGDSLLAAQLIAAIEERLDRDTSELDLLRLPTIRAMARRLEESA